MYYTPPPGYQQMYTRPSGPRPNMSRPPHDPYGHPNVNFGHPIVPYPPRPRYPYPYPPYAQHTQHGLLPSAISISKHLKDLNEDSKSPLPSPILENGMSRVENSERSIGPSSYILPAPISSYPYPKRTDPRDFDDRTNHLRIDRMYPGNSERDDNANGYHSDGTISRKLSLVDGIHDHQTLQNISIQPNMNYNQRKEVVASPAGTVSSATPNSAHPSSPADPYGFPSSVGYPPRPYYQSYYRAPSPYPGYSPFPFPYAPPHYQPPNGSSTRNSSNSKCSTDY
jgi:hypothetical protein